MFDHRLRRGLAPHLDRAAARAQRWGWRAGTLTLVGWAVGLVAVGAVLGRAWPLALLAWWVNRALDGLDGALARRRGPTEVGGFLDLVADFSIYAGLPLAVAVVLPGTRLAAAALLATYYLSGVALLGASAIADRRGLAHDERSVRLTGGLAEGAETILAYSVLLAHPASAALVEWVFAAAVAVTAVQRVLYGVALLGPARASARERRAARVAGRDGPR